MLEYSATYFECLGVFYYNIQMKCYNYQNVVFYNEPTKTLYSIISQIQLLKVYK